MTCLSFVKGLKPMNGDASAVFFGKFASYATYERKNKQPHSSVTRLIQLLTSGRRGNDMEGTVIYTTQTELSEMDRGMAKLFKMPLKNVEDNVDTERGAQAELLQGPYQVPEFKASALKCGAGVNLSQNNPAYQKIHRLYLMAAFAVVSGRLSEIASKTTGGHAIGAILVKKDGTIAGWSTNSNKRNKSQHAEVNLIQSYFARPGITQLPSGSFIYSTLKPCLMCAGMIVSCAGDAYRVIYGQDDSGDLASNTALDQSGHSELIGSGISGQLHLVNANFQTKGTKGGRLAMQAPGQAKLPPEKDKPPRGKVNVAETLDTAYRARPRDSGGLTGYLSDWGGHGSGVIGSVADRLAGKIGKTDQYYKTKYGDDTAILAVIRHIEAYLKDVGLFTSMNW
jgi:tRNA(Arg) A34 adenosine deaminase TadA